MDRALTHDAELVVYGSAAFILLGEQDRISLDIDVAAPYSKANLPDLQQAAQQAGLPINPEDGAAGDHIEWVSPLRLCLPVPSPGNEMILWRGRKLTLKTGSPEALIASKLIRYDPIDQADIQFLCSQRAIDFANIEAAVATLPPPFAEDALVRENLANLKRDMVIWKQGQP
jgi:hypothetical protein